MMTSATLASALFSWVERLVKAIRWFIQRLRQGARARYKERYFRGMRVATENRDEVARLLYSYYAITEPKSSSRANDLRTIRYLYPDGAARDLPLLTLPGLISRLNPALSVECEYSGPAKGVSISNKELVHAQEHWEALGIETWDSHQYSLCDVEGASTLTFQDTSFHLYRATYGEVYDELAVLLARRGLENVKKMSPSRLASSMPKRGQYLGSVDAMFDFPTRVCVGGIVVLFAARTEEDDLAVIVQRRSDKVSNEPRALTVIPRAYHEAGIAPELEYNLESSVYREIYEEIFGGKDRAIPHISHEFYLGICEPVRELKEGRGKNHILKPTGMVWDLYHGNYQVCYCLYVTDATWWTRYHRQMVMNWESEVKLEEAWTGKRVMKPVMTRSSKVQGFVERRDWVADAYFAFIEGLRWLAEVDPVCKATVTTLPRLVLNRI